jgi:hypothetical protein
MPRVATKLAPAGRGGFIARNIIPADVRDDYAKLYGQRTEDRLKIEPMTAGQARARHREWVSEVEARIANIRAARARQRGNRNRRRGQRVLPAAKTNTGRAQRRNFRS